MNLQQVLLSNTKLHEILLSENILFDIKNKILKYNNSNFNIDYDKLKRANSCDKKLKDVARRVYNDYGVNVFCNSHKYPSNINKKPEFLETLKHLILAVSKIIDQWINKSKGYVITFYAYLEQITSYSFGISDDYNEKDILIQMLESAIEKIICNDTKILYVKNDVSIQAEQMSQSQILCKLQIV